MTVLIEYLSEFGGDKGRWAGLRSLSPGEFAPLFMVNANGREQLGGIDAGPTSATVWRAAPNDANGAVAERDIVAEVRAGESLVFTFRGPRRPDVVRRLRIRVLAEKDT